MNRVRYDKLFKMSNREKETLNYQLDILIYLIKTFKKSL